MYLDSHAHSLPLLSKCTRTQLPTAQHCSLTVPALIGARATSVLCMNLHSHTHCPAILCACPCTHRFAAQIFPMHLLHSQAHFKLVLYYHSCTHSHTAHFHPMHIPAITGPVHILCSLQVHENTCPLSTSAFLIYMQIQAHCPTLLYALTYLQPKSGLCT